VKRREQKLVDLDLISSEVVRLVTDRIHNLDAPVHPEFLHRVETFSRALVAWGARMNLTAHPEDPAEVAFHILDSLAPVMMANRSPLEGAFDLGREALDLGGGAGFPGLILAAAADARFTIAESRRKRASFLTVAIAEMGLDNASVMAGRVDESTFHVKRQTTLHRIAGHRPAGKFVKNVSRETSAGFDVVLARAFGAPTDFYRIAAVALRSGGLAILYANPDQRLSLDIARESGLTGYTRIPYEVRRGVSTVKRVLAVWRRA